MEGDVLWHLSEFFFLLSFTWLQFICGFTELQFIHCPYSVIFHWLHIHRLLYVLLFMDIWLFTESCYFSDSHLLCMVYRAPQQSPLLCPCRDISLSFPTPFASLDQKLFPLLVSEHTVPFAPRIPCAAGLPENSWVFRSKVIEWDHPVQVPLLDPELSMVKACLTTVMVIHGR